MQLKEAILGILFAKWHVPCHSILVIKTLFICRACGALFGRHLVLWHEWLEKD